MLPWEMPKTTKPSHCSLVYFPARTLAIVPITMDATIRMRNPHKKPLTARSNNRSPRLVRMTCLLNVQGGQGVKPWPHFDVTVGLMDRSSLGLDWLGPQDSRKQDQRSQPDRLRLQEPHSD